MIVIPINNDPAQEFNIDLENLNWVFRIAYNTLDELWYMEIDQNDITLCAGIKLVSGMDLVRAFNIMQGQLVVVIGGDLNRDPTMGDWTREASLLYFSPDEVQEILTLANAPVE